MAKSALESRCLQHQYLNHYITALSNIEEVPEKVPLSVYVSSFNGQLHSNNLKLQHIFPELTYDPALELQQLQIGNTDALSVYEVLA